MVVETSRWKVGLYPITLLLFTILGVLRGQSGYPHLILIKPTPIQNNLVMVVVHVQNLECNSIQIYQPVTCFPKKARVPSLTRNKREQAI